MSFVVNWREGGTGDRVKSPNIFLGDESMRTFTNVIAMLAIVK